MMEKNKPFKWTVQAFDSAGTAVTGISASITAELRADNATSGTATTDTNPTELSDGYYDFSITSPETAVTNYLTLFPETTAATHITACPKTFQILPSNFNYLGVSSGGAVTEVNLTNECTTNTDMITVPSNFSNLSIATSGNANADVKLIEGADPSDTIRDSVVDDATRIDASALNTLSGHDPGATLGTSTLDTAQTLATLAVYDGPTRTELTTDTNSILAGITAGTGTVQADIATAQSDLDILTGTDGVTLATLQGNYAPNVVVPDSAGTAPTAAEIKTALEADGGDLSSLMEALVNKRVWTEADGTLELFNDAGVSQGTIATQITSDGFFTTAKRAKI